MSRRSVVARHPDAVPLATVRKVTAKGSASCPRGSFKATLIGAQKYTACGATHTAAIRNLRAVTPRSVGSWEAPPAPGAGRFWEAWDH